MFNNLLVLLIMCKCLVKVLNHLKVPILLKNVLVFNCSILGIQSAQLIRITARADGSGCDVYVKPAGLVGFLGHRNRQFIRRFGKQCSNIQLMNCRGTLFQQS